MCGSRVGAGKSAVTDGQSGNPDASGRFGYFVGFVALVNAGRVRSTSSL